MVFISACSTSSFWLHHWCTQNKEEINIHLHVLIIVSPTVHKVDKLPHENKAAGKSSLLVFCTCTSIPTCSQIWQPYCRVLHALFQVTQMQAFQNAG